MGPRDKMMLQKGNLIGSDNLTQIAVQVHEGNRVEWTALKPHAVTAQQIIDRFSEWANHDGADEPLYIMRDTFPNLWAEACEVGQIVGSDPMAVLAANCFYDVSIKCWACTAFAVDLPGGPVHAHCLDWDFGDDLLRKYVSLFTFNDPAGVPLFYSVGWPGFLGAFVGFSPGRFTVSLNAVWSEDSRDVGEPIGLLLRRALATLNSYDHAVKTLSQAKIASDCLLLISGVKGEEIAVVERTPCRSAVRHPSQGVILTTNHYCDLAAGSNRPDYAPTGSEPVGQGSIERYAAVKECLSTNCPQNMASCYSLLEEEPFRQPITIQRAAMRAATGQILASPMPSKSITAGNTIVTAKR